MKIWQQLLVAKQLLACCVTLLSKSFNCKVSNAADSLLHKEIKSRSEDRKTLTRFLMRCFFAADVEASSGLAAPTQYLNMSHPCVIYRSCKSFNLLCRTCRLVIFLGLFLFFSIWITINQALLINSLWELRKFFFACGGWRVSILMGLTGFRIFHFAHVWRLLSKQLVSSL